MVRHSLSILPNGCANTRRKNKPKCHCRMQPRQQRIKGIKSRKMPLGNTAQFVGSVGDAFSAICCLQIFRFTSSKPSKSAIASDEKFIRLRTNSFVRYCLKWCGQRPPCAKRTFPRRAFPPLSTGPSLKTERFQRGRSCGTEGNPVRDAPARLHRHKIFV